MDCKDLMVGDLVYVIRGYDKHLTIEKIKGVIEDEDNPYPITMSTNETVSLNDISHIPLTEEILVKNGFEKAYTKVHDIMVDENLWFGHIGADYVELRLEGNVAIWKDYDEKADGLYSDYLFPLPTSVHQLQHLLRLCGIEKEIEL